MGLSAQVIPFAFGKPAVKETYSEEIFGNSMEEAEEYLRRIGVRYTRCQENQLKFDQGISYWPRKGTIYIDGAEKADNERGPEHLLEVLRKHRLVK